MKSNMCFSFCSFLAVCCFIITQYECKNIRRDALEHIAGDPKACSGLPQAYWDHWQHVYKGYYKDNEKLFKQVVNEYLIGGVDRTLDPLDKDDVWDFGCTVAGTHFAFISICLCLKMSTLKWYNGQNWYD